MPISAAIFMLVVLAGSSVVALAQREASRVEQRSALLAYAPSPNDIEMLLGDDVWRGQQFPVYWIEPAGGAEKSVLPPGMERMPGPGQAVVSPALDRLASQQPALATRYPKRLVLSEEGIESGDELIAYVRMQEGHALQGALVKDLAKGNTRTVRVRAFGPPSGADVSAGAAQSIVNPSSERLPIGGATGGVLALLVIPAVFVLACGLSTGSVERDGRLGMFRQTGTFRRSRSLRFVVETVGMATPGLIGAAALWGVVAPRLELVPLVGQEVLRGDLRLPWWLLVAETLTCGAVVGLVAIVIAIAAKAGNQLVERAWSLADRDGAPSALKLLPIIPFVVALMAFALTRVFYGIAGALLLCAGIVATVAGIRLILPLAVRTIGIRLVSMERAEAIGAGRNLYRHPYRASRPFFWTAVLFAFFVVGSGMIASIRQGETPSHSLLGETEAVFVEGLDVHPDDLSRFADGLDGGLVAPFAEGAHSHGDAHTHSHSQDHASENGNTLTVGASCGQVSNYFTGARCDPKEPLHLTDETERAVAESMAQAVHGRIDEVRLAPAREVDSDSTLVLDNEPIEELEQRVRTVAMHTIPVPFVDSRLSTASYPSPYAAWGVAGIVSALSILTIGCLMRLAEHFLQPGQSLVRGAAPSTTRFLVLFEAWRFAVPYIAAVATGFFTGLAVWVALMGLNNAQVPWYGVGVTLAVSFVMGLAGTAAAAVYVPLNFYAGSNQKGDVPPPTSS